MTEQIEETAERKFYKTIITIEVLSEDEPWRGGLEALHYAITEGDCSAAFGDDYVVELTAEEVARELIAQGSDPEFFMLDDDGNDIEDNYDFDVEPFTLVRVTLDCSPVEDEEN